MVDPETVRMVDPETVRMVDPETGLPLCIGCGEPIDPDVCVCGLPMDQHDPMCDGHSGVPLGCMCHHMTEEEDASIIWKTT